MQQTGIVCTLGPSTNSLQTLKKMAEAGMTVVRLNFSHGTYEEYEKTFKLINALNKGRKEKIKVLADLEGHRIRLGKFKNDKIALKKYQKLILTNKKVSSDNKSIYIDYKDSFTAIKRGMDIFIDDGNLHLKVVSSKKDELTAEVGMDYILKSHKGVNIPQAKLVFAPMETKDRDNMLFALKHNVDFVANSFVRNAQDMFPLAEILREQGNTKCKLVAKIEDRSGIDNLPGILDVTDGVMVARGDMGISIPIWTVPVVQKYIIRKCRSRNIFVITATQMLESMTENPIPTRAEVSDVANAIIDGSNFIMLSAETAVGKYPIKTVKTMRNIAKFTEQNIYRLPSIR
ncbi:MAG: pyruvate kinase [Endomicrobium sp.]|jgi:pyruvate kinase|nr:pyruvate kinase [Endomicrobium sp.]